MLFFDFVTLYDEAVSAKYQKMGEVKEDDDKGLRGIVYNLKFVFNVLFYVIGMLWMVCFG